YDRSNGQTRDIQVYPRFFSGEPADALPERWQWTFPIMFAPQDSKVMYTCSQHVWKTTDDGQSWEKISPDLTYADPSTLGKTGGVITMDMNGPEIYATVFALAPSYHDINTIWAGSDDGKVHITRDGGANWEDITPKDLPKFSRVSIIDESKHHPGTLYLAANRYQVDDRQPYVFKTNDFGKTWTKIINGIEDGHFARAVREDPIRQGLLFLATEHGVYFSMNDGELWQSLQLKLPDTPIRDLVIKDNDVVIGSHGRGFWILDDIQPLRQYQENMKNQEAILYGPSDVIRGIQKASIQYYLKDQMDTITFEILDANDKLINTFTGSKPKYEEDPDLPYWLKGGSSKPTTAKGINTFSWDLRYPGATEFEGMIIWSARPQRGPKAPLGNYKVKMKIKDYEKTYPFSILMDPNLKGITEADLMEQFELANKIMQKTSMANEAVIHIRKMRNQIKENKEKVSSADYKKTMMPFLDKTSAIEQELYQVKNQSGQDPLNFPIKLNNRLASLRRSIENGEAKPTDGAYKVYEELSAELEQHLGELNKVMSNDLSKINSVLEKAGASPLEEMK
ncbi:MAG: glycosyl hydrolase, partial [Eudoraea sp.]|uniref:WD40/YVTN/BNR-like repeat-containing protein n=1 Tax=Eudoraea sp. TaxID=1979955 RepID=UPI003C72AC87